MLKFLDKSTDKRYITSKGDHLTKNGLRLRKRGEPRQAHVIPELPVIPWEDPRDRYENRLIMRLDRDSSKRERSAK